MVVDDLIAELKSDPEQREKFKELIKRTIKAELAARRARRKSAIQIPGEENEL